MHSHYLRLVQVVGFFIALRNLWFYKVKHSNYIVNELIRILN